MRSGRQPAILQDKSKQYRGGYKHDFNLYCHQCGNSTPTHTSNEHKCDDSHRDRRAAAAKRAVVALRKCTCSHFLLFVWGGLADSDRAESISCRIQGEAPLSCCYAAPRCAHRPVVCRANMRFAGTVICLNQHFLR